MKKNKNTPFDHSSLHSGIRFSACYCVGNRPPFRLYKFRCL